MASDRGSSSRRGAAAGSLIDRASHFNGVFRTAGNVVVEGNFEGEMQCDGTITVAEGATVSGTLTAGTISIAGQLSGEVRCHGQFEILETGQVSARVVSGAIIVREGAFYEGEMRMQDAMAATQAAPEPEPAAPAQPAPRGRNGRGAAVSEPAAENS
ncbi:MAG TPA: polymer-forming cytoskeletal protein [Dehalococcoidia bacterium]|nr:polymer-forming cytoskeletal protein [Dehalococcoidia bacterium]